MCYYLLIHCLFLAVLMLASQVFFRGHMEFLTTKLILMVLKKSLR